MSKRVLLFILASVLMPYCIFAQNYTVKGSVWDFDAAVPICSVAVSVYQITGNDTIFCGGDTTDDNGSFTIGNLKAGDYVLRTIFEHYFNTPKNFTLSPGTYIKDLGKIVMRYGKGDSDPAIKAVSVKIVEPKSFFNSALYDEKASAEEVIRRNPGAWKINDNGVLEVNGKEVHQMLVNGKVVYSESDTITNPARLLEEITRRVKENNSSTEPAIAHIDDRELLPDSVLTTYKLPKGWTKEEVMRKIPGLVIDDEGNAIQDGKPVKPISLDYYAKYLPSEPSKPSEAVTADIIDRESLSDTSQYHTNPYRIPDGQSFEEFISKLPGVEIHDDGSITVDGKNVERILVNGPGEGNVDSTLGRDMQEKVEAYENSKKYQRDVKRASKKEARKKK